MHVLLIGGGAREHALADALNKSPRVETLHATHTGNPGIAALARPVPVPVAARDLYRLRQFCDAQRIDLVVIGPEDPLAEGFADELARRSTPRRNAANHPAAAPGSGGAQEHREATEPSGESGNRAPSPRAVFGPTKAAAMLEADKAFAKHLMRAASIPTAEGRVFDRHDAALAYLQARDEPQVIKACGLAKGKGVFVPRDETEAEAALDTIMKERRFGDAGDRVLIEERLIGREVSAMALVDGGTILRLPHCQDYKRLRDGDTGPNTGGMGSICPAPPLDDETEAAIDRDIFVPIIDALRRESIEYRGVLYAGLMLTAAGPKVLEFNVRFGDPECQALLARLHSDPLDLLLATATGTLDSAEPRWAEEASVCLVLAAEGYPDRPVAGAEITGIDAAAAMEGITILHAGTTRKEDGTLIAAGGRVLSVVATANTPELARNRAYQAADQIHFQGKQIRRDIGI